MGDVVITTQNARTRALHALIEPHRRLIAASAVLAIAAAVAVGCSSSKPARVVEAAPARSAAPAEAARVSPPVEIRSLEVREGAPDVFVELTASAPLVWTSFRNAQGQVVLELPNAVPGSGVGNVAPDDGLISSLLVSRADDGDRPMTRLVVATRQEVEHSVSADGSGLQLRLLPVDGARAALAFEPVAPEPARPASVDQAAAEQSAAPVQADQSTAPVPATDEPSSPAAARPAEAMPATMSADIAVGTPDAPAVAPAPSGAAATRLEGIEILAQDGGAVIKIAGDGEFPYSSFALTEPARFVIDLSGVVNRSARSTVSVDSSLVERVRVAQFRPQPQPVARVVFDLREAVVPRIERTSGSLVVTFSTVSAASTASGEESPVEPRATPRPALSAEPAPAAPAPGTVRSQQSTPAPARLQASEQEAIEEENAEAVPAPVLAQVPPPPPPPRRPVSPPVPAPSTAGQPSDLELRSAAAGGPTAASTAGFASQDLGSGEVERKYVGDPIDLKVTNADVTDVLRSFAQLSGLNIIVQPGVSGTVTAELENVPWDQALEQVLRINKLGYEVEGNIMRIAPTQTLRDEARERQELAQARALAIPLRTVMKRLNYADADDLARLMRQGTTGLLSQRGSVIVDGRTNTLIIKELPTFMDAVIGVIEMLDTPEPQVMIEARIIETTKRFTRDLGINWGFDAVSSAANGNTSGLVFPNNGSVEGNVDVGGETGNVLRLRLGNVLDTFTLDVALQAAETEGLINILSAPKVATLNNQRASIQSGLQIPIQTVANNTVTVQFVNATLRLDVTPQVTAEGTVLMDIDISKREPQLAFLVPGATNAPIATKDARTRLVVRDGGTAVIGGIYKVSTDEGQDRIPGLANIPIIGHLFKNKSQRDENEELLIFITPRIIKI